MTHWSGPDLLSPVEIAEFCSYALGENICAVALMMKGERIACLEKTYNLIHTDFGKQDDFFTSVFVEEAIEAVLLRGKNQIGNNGNAC